MKMAKTLLAAVISAAAFSATVQAGEVSTNIGVTSNYMWRGTTQSGMGAAVSGGIDYADDSGFFVGTWVSNTAWGSSETDLYLGYGGEAGDFGYSVTFNYYAYPSIDDSNFGDILLDFSYNIVSFGLAYTAVSDYDEPSAYVDGDLYYYVGVGFDLGNDWSLGATYGFYDFDYDGDPEVGDVSYGYFQIDLGKSYGDWGDFTLSLSKADEESGEEDPITWVSWSKGF